MLSKASLSHFAGASVARLSRVFLTTAPRLNSLESLSHTSSSLLFSSRSERHINAQAILQLRIAVLLIGERPPLNFLFSLGELHTVIERCVFGRSLAASLKFCCSHGFMIDLRARAVCVMDDGPITVLQACRSRLFMVWSPVEAMPVMPCLTSSAAVLSWYLICTRRSAGTNSWPCCIPTRSLPDTCIVPQ